MAEKRNKTDSEMATAGSDWTQAHSSKCAQSNLDTLRIERIICLSLSVYHSPFLDFSIYKSE